jgi:hypothetical protein
VSINRRWERTRPLRPLQERVPHDV